MSASTELEERCAFLERELSEVGIQLDAAQKRLRLAIDVVEVARRIRPSTLKMYEEMLKKALAAWDAVPGDEGGLHDTEGR